MGEWGGQSSGGKITVLRAGPGYHEQKEYDIGPDGRITEVTSTAAPLSIMENDACKGGKIKSSCEIEIAGASLNRGRPANLRGFDAVSLAVFFVPVPMLRIHDILVWTWIRGSMPLTNGSQFGSGSCYFRH